MDNIKTILKLFIPPIILKLYSYIRKPKKNPIPNKNTIQFQKTELAWVKTELSWDDVLKQTSNGYSAEQILTKCRDSLLKVKNGEFPYERDSVLFTEKEIFYPLLSSLLYVALENDKKLNLIDFGGSLGSTYFQNRDILKQAGIDINWNIVEQDNFVKCGKEYFSNNELHFYNEIDELINKEGEVSVCIFSSVLPYLKEPYSIFDSIQRHNIKYIIIDRTLFLDNETEDILSIQTIPPEIYEASYPAWFLSLNKFLDFFEHKYSIVFKWNCSDNVSLPSYKTSVMGFFLERIF